jgi:hypothetical protein
MTKSTQVEHLMVPRPQKVGQLEKKKSGTNTLAYFITLSVREKKNS